MLLSRDALVSVQEKLRWQVLDRHLIVVLRLLVSVVTRGGVVHVSKLPTFPWVFIIISLPE